MAIVPTVAQVRAKLQAVGITTTSFPLAAFQEFYGAEVSPGGRPNAILSGLMASNAAVYRADLIIGGLLGLLQGSEASKLLKQIVADPVLNEYVQNCYTALVNSGLTESALGLGTSSDPPGGSGLPVFPPGDDGGGRDLPGDGGGGFPRGR